MSNSNLITQEEHSIGDAAVDGLLNGIIAGVGMGLYVLLIFLVYSVPAGEIIEFFGSFTDSPLVSALIHLAISGIYGVLFGLASGIAMGFGSYSYMPITLALPWSWFLGSLVEATVAGAIVGAIVKA